MMSRKGPIVIVGGRVAGLLTAGLLARNGEEVIVLERAALGASTVSIALLCPDTLAIFDEVGFGTRLDAIGLTRIEHLSFEILPKVRVAGPFPPSFGRSWGYAIRRELLDELLQRHVVAKYPNITWVDSFHVDALIRSNGRVNAVEGVGRDGVRRRIEGDIVVGADGKFSTVAKLAEAAFAEIVNIRTCFYYAYFQGSEPNETAGALSTYHGVLPFPFVAFSQDAENGLIGVGVQASERRFPAFRRDPSATLINCVKSFPELRERLEGAVIASKVKGILIPAQHKREVWGAGWALVGDAAVHINPITGQGISFAARAAMWLSEAVTDWRRGADEGQSLNAYKHRLFSAFHADFYRAAAAADIEAPIETSRQQCYSWMAQQQYCVDAWLRMFTNAISIAEFEERSGLADAERMFGQLEQRVGRDP